MTSALFDHFDFFMAPSHERTCWAFGLGLPMFIALVAAAGGAGMADVEITSAHFDRGKKGIEAADPSHQTAVAAERSALEEKGAGKGQA